MVPGVAGEMTIREYCPARCAASHGSHAGQEVNAESPPGVIFSHQDFPARPPLVHRARFSCAFARVLPGASKSGPYGCAYAPKRN